MRFDTPPRQWWHYFLDVIGFVVVLLLLERAAHLPIITETLGIPLTWGTATDQIAVMSYFAETDPPDILIVGSSVAQNSVYPRQMEEQLKGYTGEDFTVISAADNWLSADVTYDVITQIIPQIHQPRLLLYPVFPLDFVPEEASYQKLFLDSSSLLSVYVQTPILQPLIMDSQFIQYSTNVWHYLLHILQPIPVNNYRGFRYETFVAEGVEGYAGSSPQLLMSPTSFATQRFYETLQWTLEHDIFLVVFQSPLPLTYRSSPTGQINQAALDSLLKIYDAEFPHMVYLDLYAEGPLQAENGFADMLHVNINGATEWTGRLVKALVEENILIQAGVVEEDTTDHHEP